MGHPLILDLPTPEATERLARTMAEHVVAGDALLLQGPIGAGKSHFARALIRARLGNPAEEVPSPSFTLVQSYPGTPPIWHADLYRLTGPDEVLELGLDEAFQSAIALVEWPDRLGSDLPRNPITVALSLKGEGRQAAIALEGRPGMVQALRALAAEGFIASCGWTSAQRRPLSGDASGRRLERLRLGQTTAVFLDNPPGLPDRLDDFVRVDRHLRGIGLSAPEILAEDRDNGFLLLEDLGDTSFARRLSEHPDDQARLYALATDALLVLQASPAPAGLPDLTAEAWAEAAMICITQYAAGIAAETLDATPLRQALAGAIRQHADGPRVMIHRDYFSANLMLLPRDGVRAVGMIDFQLAQLGQPAYDLVSLLQDARRDVDPVVEAAMKLRFASAKGFGPGFELAYAVWGVQRALRILGVFARLCRVEGRTEYLIFLPRVLSDLRRNLGHPALAGLQQICDRMLPDATPHALSRLRSQCGAFR